MTVVSGISGDEIENVTKNLKNMLACGGTHKDDTIELQGNHKDDAIKALIKLGYNESNIDVA